MDVYNNKISGEQDLLSLCVIQLQRKSFSRSIEEVETDNLVVEN